MGKRGPRPMPTHLRLLRGNPQKEPMNKNEPQPVIEPAVPAAPPFLTGYAGEEWTRIAKELWQLKLLSRVDMQPLAAYCEAYAIWRNAIEAYETIAARDPTMRGLMIKSAKGTPLQNPIVPTFRQAAGDMVRFAAEFGFNPGGPLKDIERRWRRPRE